MKHIVAGIAGSTRIALIGGVALAALVAPAQAQAVQEAAQAAQEEAQPAPDAAAPEATGNEIVVTATKREQTLQDVPVAVTVTTAQTIERAQIRDIRDLSTVVPSLRVNTLQSSANTNFYIRGFGNGANNAGIEPSVGLFVDGVYRSRSASMIADLPDVQRIEVLRGPQSTLFGKNASAGVISLVTKQPQYQLGGNLEASYGNYNAVVVKGYVTGPLGENLAASLAGGYNKRDGYVRDLGTNTRTNERNRWFTRGQLLFEPSSDLKIRLIGDYSRIDENCCAVVNLQPSPPPGPTQIITAPVAFGGLGAQVNDYRNPFADVTYSNLPSTNKIDNWGFSGQVDYNMGLLKLTSITAYRKTKAITNQDSDFTSADLLSRNYQDLRIDTFTQELRATTDWDGPLNVLVGAFYFNEKINQSNELFLGSQFRPYADGLIKGATQGAFNVGSLNPTKDIELILGGLDALAAGTFPATAGRYVGQFFGNGRGLTEAYSLKDDNFSIFTQFDFKATDRLTLTGGVNYTHDSKRFVTNVLPSTETFSTINFDSPNYASLRNKLLLGGALQQAGIDPNNTAAVTAFATGAGTAPIYAQMVAFANANQNNPAVNPLNALKPLQFLPNFVNLPNASESGKVSDGHWSFTARAAYDLSDHLNVYASYATGYKAASVNLSRDSRPPALGSRYADPETSEVWEAGLKGNWGLVTANMAVFKQSIKGFQSNIFTGTGFKLANAGKQSAFGIEFEGTAKPVDALTLSLAVTYLDPTYDSFPLSGVGDLSGRTPGGISPLTASFGAQWDQDLGNDDHLILRGDFHYEAPFALVEGLPNLIVSTTNPATGAITRDYRAAIAAATSRKQEIKLLNASLTYAMANGLEFTVWGRNLTNNRTILQIFDSPVQIGSISGYPSEPRTWGGAVRFRF